MRGRIEKVLDAAKAKGFRQGENPARWRGHLDHLLPRQPKLRRGHHAAMPYEEVASFIAKLRERDSLTAQALELCILTAARSGEILGMRWDEVDLESKLWTVPAHRMKAGREHRIPLPSRAVSLLRHLKQAGESEFVFPGVAGGKPLSGMAMEMVLRRMKRAPLSMVSAPVFGTGPETRPAFPARWSKPLAHVIGNEAEQAYRRSDAPDKRRKLMEAWAGYCEQQRSAKILRIAPDRNG